MRAASSGLTLSQSVAFLMEMRGRPAATNRSSRGGREAEAEENREGTEDQEEELLPSLLVNSRPAFTLFWCQSRCRKFPEKDETVRFCCSDMNLSHMTSSSLQLRLVGGWGWRGGGGCQWKDFLVHYIPCHHMASPGNEQPGFNKWLPWRRGQRRLLAAWDSVCVFRRPHMEERTAVETSPSCCFSFTCKQPNELQT
ncbi:hypothetical protein FQA47_001463 [Oryzias melastigma]|uniref:Uncharacterized protein n=1 Tax=Oryzias melastigma TaxID=30732 RepID=A0A834FRM2_ORYME|nr:hypothetical protein FQA47_001463 [Oryzias melastigma]